MKKTAPQKSNQDKKMGFWGNVRSFASLGVSVWLICSVVGWLETRSGLDIKKATQRAGSIAQWECHRSTAPAACSPKLVRIEPIVLPNQALSWRFHYTISPPNVLPKRKLVVNLNTRGEAKLSLASAQPKG